MSAQLATSFVRLEKPRISGQASCSRLLPRYWPRVICLVQKRHLSEASKAYSHDITSSIKANSVTWTPGPLNDVLVVVLYPCFSVTRVATSLQVRQGLEIPVIRGVCGFRSIMLLYSGKFVIIIPLHLPCLHCVNWPYHILAWISCTMLLHPIIVYYLY